MSPWTAAGPPAGTAATRTVPAPQRSATAKPGASFGRKHSGPGTGLLCGPVRLPPEPGGRFPEAVDEKIRWVAAEIAAGRHEDGWAQGPRRIVEEMIDETIDIPAWARGLELYEVSERVEARIERAIEHASEAYTELQLALREIDEA